MNMLEFANPMGWWWAALALPILAFYILKVRLRRQSVSTLLFWDRVFDEKKPRAWWQQLRHWLSLLLQWAFLLLIVGALVDPLWSWQKNECRKTVLVLDNSASMNATAGPVTRLESARQAARALVRSMRPGDEMAVITAGGRPQVAIGLSDHGRALLEAIDALPPTDAPTVLSDAVTAARRLVFGQQQSRIYVLTDGCAQDIASLQADKDLTIFGFGDKLDNVGITQLQVRRSLLDAIGYQILVEVSNFSDATQTRRLELSLEDELVDVIPLSLEAGQSRVLNLDQASAGGGRLEAQLDVRDALEQDNVARAILPKTQPIPITLITPGSLFLKTVFESVPLVQLTVASEYVPLAKRDVSAAQPPTITSGSSRAPIPDTHRIHVFHRTVPEKIPPGRVLVVDPQNSCDLWQLGEKIEHPIVMSVSNSSPITQHVRLDNVLFPVARQMSFTEKPSVLVSTPLDEPLLAQLHRPRGDCIVLTVDLDQGDLPLRIAFPVMMKNAIEWFQGAVGELRPASATGQTVSIELRAEPLPEAEELEYADAATGMSLTAVEAEASEQQLVEFQLQSPNGTVTPLARGQQSAMVGPLLHCGIWTVVPKPPAAGSAVDNLSRDAGRVSNDERIMIACNLSNKDESDLRPRIELEQFTQLGALGFGGRSIWFYLALAGLMLIAIEWWLYQRRLVG